MDEFMVSGETMVRDLQFGIARARELGGDDARRLPARHVRSRRADAAAPAPRRPRARGRVARRARRRSTGPRSGGTRPTARRVRAEYLYGSYSNGRDIPNDATQLVRPCPRLRRRARRRARSRRRHAPHERHRPPDAAAVARSRGRRRQRDAGRLPVRGHVAGRVPRDAADRRPRDVGRRAALRRARQPAHGCGVEPRRRAPACAAHAERALERRAEPLSALLLPPGRRTPTRCSTSGWRKLVLNSAHDSSCACSADEVVDQVLVRYQEARQIGEALARDAVRALAAHVDVPPASTVVVNPTARDRGRGRRASRSRDAGRCTASRSTTAPRAPRRWCAPRPPARALDRWSSARRCAGCSR